jgi:5-methylcytosine-specific restriction endonuclease McrA
MSTPRLSRAQTNACYTFENSVFKRRTVDNISLYALLKHTPTFQNTTIGVDESRGVCVYITEHASVWRRLECHGSGPIESMAKDVVHLYGAYCRSFQAFRDLDSVTRVSIHQEDADATGDDSDGAIGHTDGVSDPDLPDKVSSHRKEVLDLLVDRGIPLVHAAMKDAMLSEFPLSYVNKVKLYDDVYTFSDGSRLMLTDSMVLRARVVSAEDNVIAQTRYKEIGIDSWSTLRIRTKAELEFFVFTLPRDLRRSFRVSDDEDVLGSMCVKARRVQRAYKLGQSVTSAWLHGSGDKPKALNRPSMHIQRRIDIAAAQGWCCADPFGDCPLPGRRLEAQWEIDHRTPWAVSGDDSSSNLDALCPRCHAKKTKLEATRKRERE